MARGGGNPGKPVWSEFKKSNTTIIVGSIIILCVAACIWSIYSTSSTLIDQIVNTRPFQVLTASKKPKPKSTVIKINAVGDVMMGRAVGLSAARRQDWAWPFHQVSPILANADMVLGNLEFPITDSCQLIDLSMIFCAPPESTVGLKEAGFTAVSVANNHSYNYGNQGLEDTITILNQNNIIPLLKNTPHIYQYKNLKIALLAIDDISTQVNQDNLVQIISTMKQESDLAIILVHWGHEYWDKPSERQVELAQAMVTAGADIILGSHPHVLQPIENNGNSLVAYSLGNFVFDQMWSDETRHAGILQLTVTFSPDHKITNLSHVLLPTTIYDYGQPRFNQE